MTEKISTVALRAKARKQGGRITVKGGIAQLLEYNSNVDGWLAADNYWGVLSHPWTYQEVWDMLTQRA